MGRHLVASGQLIIDQSLRKAFSESLKLSKVGCIRRQGMWRVHPLLGTHACALQHGLVARALQRVQLTHSAQRLASFRPAASAASAGMPCCID